MSETPLLETVSQPSSPPAAPPPAEQWMSELGTLLAQLESMTASNQQWPAVAGQPPETRLVQLRLGMAGSLFAALQCKHAATAGHCLRVALTCSAWATRLGFDEPQREQLEIAALLHDIGVDRHARSRAAEADALDSDEAAVMAAAAR